MGLGQKDEGIGLRDSPTAVKKAKTRFRWTITGKDSFEKVVNKLHELNESLYRLTLDSPERKLLADSRASRVLISVEDSVLLDIFRNAGMFDRALSQSAQAKSYILRSQDTAQPVLPTSISFGQIQFYGGSDTCGSLQTTDGAMLPTWVEWNVIAAGSNLREYESRLNNLAGVLEHVSDSAIRLPICYGVCNDRAYQARHGHLRLGYVFGLPGKEYDDNLKENPPRTLKDMIRERHRPPEIPMLGDRFRLAQALAVAFGRFHAAKWLHKGFHADNIVFLQRKDANRISLTDPFITGFQYSRPQGRESFSRGPLEDDNLQYYYHPDADVGFTKVRDLYSLGVVLYEIGRWGLLGDSISPSRRATMTDRTAWQQYTMKASEAELNWRVGKIYHDVVRTLLRGDLQEDDDVLFSQQYFSRVVQPLQACVA
ncbi:hypothetical protein OPT61_g10423 [Boeremia exigua]|uniref:Uncharacterized protein n=1 Tax=Boeremia exigua TaxID=749465 RepID=A0ACC2HPT9_9PLEO|nr:hypothetical protein OPT61_g10423 [Boeremia exigua]